jgi:LCP family protein required for cell wall assembly
MLGAFVGGGLVSGYVFVVTLGAILRGEAPPPPPVVRVRDVPIVVVEGVTSIRPTSTPARSVPASTATATPEPEEPLPVWDGKDRVTVLLLGVDQRDDEKGLPTRSDTMILATLDPLNLTGGLLSLPRDLWVPIRGHGEGKINTAHFYGELDSPGGGPELARKTVQYNIGVPIHYVARVDFSGFVKLIDAIDGITVDVDRAILDDEYPNEEYGISRLYIPPGPQRMSGRVALKYARSRHADSDFGRIQRQRKVIQAAREEALALGIVPKLPRMLGIVRDAVTTDVPTTTMLALANVARQVPSSAIVSRQVDATQVIDVNGDSTVLLPDRDKIRAVVQEVFYDPVVRKESARIEVLNGTARDGLATATRAALLERGYTVTRADSAERTGVAETTIVDHGGKGATAAALATVLGVDKRNVKVEAGGSGADVTVVLGTDFRGVR